jgi:hypothetical protein
LPGDRRWLDVRALVLALVALCAGGALGAAAFALEQARADWRPHVTRTATGWRIRQPHVQMNTPALAGRHLAWQAGPDTIVMDLSSGDTRLIGAGHDSQSVFPPVVSRDAVAWAETTGSSSQTTSVYSYDFSSGRRRHRQTPSLWTGPVLVGATAYWAADWGDTDANGAAVVGCDLRTGHRRTLATLTHYAGFLAADDSFVVWSRQDAPLAPFTLTVMDVTNGDQNQIALPGQTSGATFDAPVIANHTLVWLRIDTQSRIDTITAYDLRTFAYTLVASGRGLSPPGFDGTTVVWSQPAPDGQSQLIMGLRLSTGAAFQIAQVDGAVQSAIVSGGTVAWWIDGGDAGASWIETARLPR